MNRKMKTTYLKKSTLLWVGLLCLLLILCACDGDEPHTEEQSSAVTDTGVSVGTDGETRPLPDEDTAKEEDGSEDTAHKDTEETTETDSEKPTDPEDGEATTENPEIELPKVDFD
jgi:cytoskeletal protein RodZ